MLKIQRSPLTLLLALDFLPPITNICKFWLVYDTFLLDVVLRNLDKISLLVSDISQGAIITFWPFWTGRFYIFLSCLIFTMLYSIYSIALWIIGFPSQWNCNSFMCIFPLRQPFHFWIFGFSFLWFAVKVIFRPSSINGSNRFLHPILTIMQIIMKYGDPTWAPIATSYQYCKLMLLPW